MKRAVMVLIALIMLVIQPLVIGLGQEPDKKIEELDKNKVSALMQRKLTEAQKVLQGVAMGDFDMISKHAEQLDDISKLAEWRVIRTPRYDVFSGEFQRSAQALIKHAKDKNLDAAALSYVEMTLNCVKCHKYVREVRMVRLDD